MLKFAQELQTTQERRAAAKERFARELETLKISIANKTNEVELNQKKYFNGLDPAEETKLLQSKEELRELKYQQKEKMELFKVLEDKFFMDYEVNEILEELKADYESRGFENLITRRDALIKQIEQIDIEMDSKWDQVVGNYDAQKRACRNLNVPEQGKTGYNIASELSDYMSKRYWYLSMNCKESLYPTSLGMGPADFE